MQCTHCSSLKGINKMRVVALEEHFLLPHMLERLGPLAETMAWNNPKLSADFASLGPRRSLADIGAGRIEDMDRHGIDVQVLSASMPGADLLEGADGVAYARAVNDELAEAVAANPTRFAGFAHLPMQSPSEAADELERTVREFGFCGAMINGTASGIFLDDPRYEVLLDRAQTLNVPLYLHPNLPPAQVTEAYYSNLPGGTGELLGMGMFGWHAEVAIHVMRLALSGAMSKYPSLKFIVGHMGEMLPSIIARADYTLRKVGGSFEGSLQDLIVDRVFITTSGFFTTPPLLAALGTFGADRIMFSVDYPYSSNAEGVDFLRHMPLSPIDMPKVAYGNADKLLGLASPIHPGSAAAGAGSPLAMV
jgi:predicted TIM-barrel fold metal-dependent hydrolase